MLKGLVTNYRELGGGGASEVVTPTKIGRGVKVLAMLMGGGGTSSFEVVLTPELEVLAIVK